MPFYTSLVIFKVNMVHQVYVEIHQRCVGTAYCRVYVA